MQRIVSLVAFGLALCQASDKITSIPNLDPALQCWDSYSGYLPVEVTHHALSLSLPPNLCSVASDPRANNCLPSTALCGAFLCYIFQTT